MFLGDFAVAIKGRVVIGKENEAKSISMIIVQKRPVLIYKNMTFPTNANSTIDWPDSDSQSDVEGREKKKDKGAAQN